MVSQAECALAHCLPTCKNQHSTPLLLCFSRKMHYTQSQNQLVGQATEGIKTLLWLYMYKRWSKGSLLTAVHAPSVPSMSEQLFLVPVQKVNWEHCQYKHNPEQTYPKRRFMKSCMDCHHQSRADTHQVSPCCQQQPAVRMAARGQLILGVPGWWL